MTRRRFAAVTGGALAGLADLGFLNCLRPVTAAEAQVGVVQPDAHVHRLVRLLEETPRERVLEEVAVRVRDGTSYRELLAALLLAGVRNIQPRPVGFKFHAVLVVNSAHLASLASPDTDRWLPIFWAIDQFKNSQAADVREGDWTMGPVDEAAVPPAHRARQAFVNAMEKWDESAADAAIVGLVRSAGAHEIFELLCRYAARDFREIGHKTIYLSNSFRTLEAIGWHHAEPVLRSLVYAILDRNRDRENPAEADLPADRPYRHTLEIVSQIKPTWLEGKVSREGTLELLRAIRDAEPNDTSDLTVALLNRGVAPRSIFDALFDASGELLMQIPGILSLHATTFTNAVHYAWHHCADEDTRKLLLLQNAAFMPLFRGRPREGVHIDEVEPMAPQAEGEAAVDEICQDISQDRMVAARKILAYLQGHPDPRPLANAFRRLIFLKGRNSHDYKFSSAVLEDYLQMAPPWRDRFLAASVYNMRGAGEKDTGLAVRIREALQS